PPRKIPRVRCKSRQKSHETRRSPSLCTRHLSTQTRIPVHSCNKLCKTRQPDSQSRGDLRLRYNFLQPLDVLGGEIQPPAGRGNGTNHVLCAPTDSYIASCKLGRRPRRCWHRVSSSASQERNLLTSKRCLVYESRRKKDFCCHQKERCCNVSDRVLYFFPLF
ncbi:unnamed protein product, partial [Ectocarpus sp. 4 AP-2014]